MLKLDYTLQTPEERNELVKKYLEENPDTNERYLETLADYLIIAMEKQEKREGKRKALTNNQAITIGKRELSFEGLAEQMRSKEDGIYNFMDDNRHAIFRPKVSITKKDLAEVPYLPELQQAIAYWDHKVKTTTGKNNYIAKKALVESRKDQYALKFSYQHPISTQKITCSRKIIELPNEETIVGDRAVGSGVSLLDPKVISAILSNYSRLKQAGYQSFENETWYLMEDFDALCAKALKPYPVYERLIEYKIDGYPNAQIQQLINEEFGLSHTIEYISVLWRRRIPKIIALEAESEYLDWYYLTQEYGTYKRCSRCGQIKLALPRYFSKNNTSKDGFYSVCKQCRNKGKGQIFNGQNSSR